MVTETMTPNTIRKLGIEALAKALGPVGMVRFLQQFDLGSGDYTKERVELLKDVDMKTLIAEAKKTRRKK